MALNVECEELERWKELVEVDDAVGKERMKQGEGRGDRIWASVSRMRGWDT